MCKENFTPRLIYTHKIEGIYSISDDHGFLKGSGTLPVDT